MARPTTGFVWVAAVLTLTLLGGGVSAGLEDLLDIFSLGTRPVKIFCKQNPSLFVTVRDNAVVLAPTDKTNRQLQEWTVVCMCDGKLADDQGYKAFALVNKASGQVMVNKNIKSSDNLVHVQLASHNDEDSALQLSMLWTVGDAIRDNFREVRVFRDVSQTLNGLYGNVQDGTVLGVYPSSPNSDNTIWKFTPAY